MQVTAVITRHSAHSQATHRPRWVIARNSLLIMTHTSLLTPPHPPLHLLSIALSLLLLLLSPLLSHAELLGTVLVSRHGTRAPNAIASQLCPANAANFERYLSLDISLEGVTGRGMHEMLQLGEYTREEYVDSGFLKPYYSNDEMYIRAVGEDRTLQSAVAWGQGLYPAGHAPLGYRNDLPSPLPVYTLPDELDILLENRKAGCHQRLKADVQHYDDTVGLHLRRQHAALLTELEQLCGVNLTAAVNGTEDNYGDAVKDITDNWTFDFIEHFPPLPGLTLPSLLEFRSFAVQQLIGRILGTAEQVTYMNGDLPLSMLRSFKALIDHRTHHLTTHTTVPPLKFIAYHGHREMMYALAAFFDIRYNITYPALPLGAIPPATSLFFELHYEGGEEESEKGGGNGKAKGRGKGREREGAEHVDDYVVKAVLWSPCDVDEVEDADRLVTVDTTNFTHTLNVTRINITHIHHNHSHLHNTTIVSHSTTHHRNTHSHASSPSAHHSDDASLDSGAASSATRQCGGRPTAISACPGGVCSFTQFRHLVHSQIHSTGDWRSLCAYDQRTGTEKYDDDTSDSSDTKIPGAGQTEGDHSKAHQRDEPRDEETEGESGGVHSLHSSTGGSEGGGGKRSLLAGWGAVVWVLAAAVVLGAIGYWWFFVRGDRRGEYAQVPSRP